MDLCYWRHRVILRRERNTTCLVDTTVISLLSLLKLLEFVVPRGVVDCIKHSEQTTLIYAFIGVLLYIFAVDANTYIPSN